ncbi:MAG: lytic murein transglycosylase, partial [Actinomycetota bacterium]|nr:lytic murein transglycosylase [Actinomycetota bacterium]
MRNRLVITLALGVLVAVLAAGAVGAQDAGTGVSIDGGTVGTEQVLPACSNGADDDGDGLVDLGDAGCTDPIDGDETDVVVPPPVPVEVGEDVPAGGEGTAEPDPAPVEPEPVEPDEPDEPRNVDGGGSIKVPDEKDPFGDGKVGDQGNVNGEGQDELEEKTFGLPEEKEATDDDREPLEESAIRRPNGAPTKSNPSVTLTDFGSAPIGVPNFVIDQFSIPPFLLPIYQACGTQYGIPWEVLASINRIETAFGTNLNVSTAGALGWMQFIPSSWEAYGTDANGDGRKDPYNPVDAICAAARYLKAAGAEEDLPTAIFAYNHADWYVDEVLLYAEQYGDLPSGIVDSLTGLTEGAHFPVAAKARYADDISERAALRRATPKQGVTGNAADVVNESPTRRGIDIFAAENAPVVAVNDGVIEKTGKSKKLGNFIVLRDAYGNEFTYAGLGSVSDVIPVPRERKLSTKDFRLVTPGDGDEKPKVEASGTDRATAAAESEHDGSAKQANGKNRPSADDAARLSRDAGPTNTEDTRERLYALPERPANIDRANLTGQLDDVLGKGMPGYETFKSYFSGVLRFDDRNMDTEPLREGSRVVAGTVLGRIGVEESGTAAHVNFAIAPAGRGASTIDPKPILDGWKLLEATAIYRAAGKNPFDEQATVGQVLLASKSQLQRRVLADPMLEAYECGRQDFATGQIDRRVMAMLEYLAARGFRLTITSLKCGHSVYTTSGNVSAHSTGDAVDIAQVNGIPILGNQGRGSITEAVIQELLKLQGTMAPAQVISLMEMGGPTFAMSDHADHIHVGYTPDGTDSDAQPLSTLLGQSQW